MLFSDYAATGKARQHSESEHMTAPVYQHSFLSVEDYLHHRPPYLMVSGIDAIGERTVETNTRFSGEEYFLRGHFPGAPVVPGAVLQEITTQSAGILLAARFNPMPEYNTHDPFFNEFAIGVLIRMKTARFRGFARPGDVLQTHVELTDQVDRIFELTGRVTVDGRVLMSNRFQLANIPSRTLQGSGEQPTQAVGPE